MRGPVASPAAAAMWGRHLASKRRREQFRGGLGKGNASDTSVLCLLTLPFSFLSCLAGTSASSSPLRAVPSSICRLAFAHPSACVCRPEYSCFSSLSSPRPCVPASREEHEAAISRQGARIDTPRSCSTRPRDTSCFGPARAGGLRAVPALLSVSSWVISFLCVFCLSVPSPACTALPRSCPLPPFNSSHTRCWAHTAGDGLP